VASLPPSETTAWRAVVRVLRSPLDAIGCAAFPSNCRICNFPLLQISSSPVCADCWSDLPEQSKNQLCTICGEHLGWGDLRLRGNETQSICAMCERVRPAFEQAVAYGVYEGTLRALIHLLKYEHVAPVADALGELLAGAVMNLRDLPDAITVVPVPLHASKQRERSFNQTVLLAEAAVRALRHDRPTMQIEFAAHAMERLRSTPSQSGLTPRQRRMNLRGVFSVREPKRVAGQTVLLIDDIYTTGATARECTRTLLQAGAAAVYVATLARSQREGVAMWDSFVPKHAIPARPADPISSSSAELSGGTYATC